MSDIVVIHPKELSDIRGEIADLTGGVDAAMAFADDALSTASCAADGEEVTALKARVEDLERQLDELHRLTTPLLDLDDEGREMLSMLPHAIEAHCGLVWDAVWRIEKHLGLESSDK